MNLNIDKEIIRKFDVPGPRYTSYPTAPTWARDVNEAVYIEKLKDFSRSDKTLSLYVHIPFCESLCIYCGCNTILRRPDPKFGDKYLQYLFKEMDLIVGHIGSKRKVRQLHWGGGTPTYLNEDQIERLFRKVQKNFDIDLDGEIAIEIDPRTIDAHKLKKLRDLGFNRVSLGVQDFDDRVQKLVNRIQPFDQVKVFNDQCHELGFTSVNFDLIYGLPGQSLESYRDTIEKVIALKPDRIALYSFAYIPWLKKYQKKINPKQLPSNDEKLDIFLNSRQQLLNSGYQAIAMDHFALASDELSSAFNQGSLYRNFMGYTVKPADEYIGMGLTSISFLENTFVQNEKILKDYYKALDEGRLPVEKGKVMSEDDQRRQWVINMLMCRFKVDKEKFQKRFGLVFDECFQEEQLHIKQCVEDKLLCVNGNVLQVEELGKIFVRNVCMGFDYYLRQKGAHKRFSRTV